LDLNRIKWGDTVSCGTLPLGSDEKVDDDRRIPSGEKRAEIE
jgi:hypothetical protein